MTRPRPEPQWRDPATGDGLTGPAVEVLEPALLDLYGECLVTLSPKATDWIQGVASRIPESVALEAERCLRAALDAYAMALQHCLDDQLRAIAAREGAPHWFSIVAPPRAPNALQCATRALGPCYDDPHRPPVLWRPVVELSSSAERVRLEMRAAEHDAGAVTVDIDRASVRIVVAGEATSVAHDGDAHRLLGAGEALAETARAAVTRAQAPRDPRRLSAGAPSGAMAFVLA